MQKPEYTPLYDLLGKDVPLIFADGTQIYENLAKKYIQHKVGYFIMAPSGAGKTHFVKAQNEPHWLDGDDLWQQAKAQPDGEWWLESREFTDYVDVRSDVITYEAKSLGFWIVGASNNWLPPDAIVIPHLATHRKWITHREKHGYDGGLTSDRMAQVISHRKWISKWTAKGVPKFNTVPEAAAYLSTKTQ